MIEYLATLKAEAEKLVRQLRDVGDDEHAAALIHIALVQTAKEAALVAAGGEWN